MGGTPGGCSSLSESVPLSRLHSQVPKNMFPPPSVVGKRCRQFPSENPNNCVHPEVPIGTLPEPPPPPPPSRGRTERCGCSGVAVPHLSPQGTPPACIVTTGPCWPRALSCWWFPVRMLASHPSANHLRSRPLEASFRGNGIAVVAPRSE